MIVAAFNHEAELVDAIGRLREAGITSIETYTPAPLEDMDETSPLPLVILLAAIVGAAASFGLQVFSSMVAYPLDIGDRPTFAWPSFIPTTFENAVLVAIAAGFAGFMIVNRLPKLYDPIDEAELMRGATSDRWCLAVSGNADRLVQARDVLRGSEIEELKA